MMKWFTFVLAAVLLCGCGAQPTFETVNDDVYLPVSAQIRQVKLDLPKEAARPALQSADGDSLYLCDGYTLAVQTFSGGDLNATLEQLTGYSEGRLQPICTKSAGVLRYDLSWTAAGEGGDQVGRAVILDDGIHHYAVSVMSDAEKAGVLQNTWNTLLGSVAVSTD